MMEKVTEKFAKKLKELRNSRGLSQEELAEQANLSVNSISLLERGKRFPRAATIDALAEALHTDSNLIIAAMLSTGEPSQEEYTTYDQSPSLNRLNKLLEYRPESQITLILDLALRIMKELPRSEEVESECDYEELTTKPSIEE